MLFSGSLSKFLKTEHTVDEDGGGGDRRRRRNSVNNTNNNNDFIVVQVLDIGKNSIVISDSRHWIQLDVDSCLHSMLNNPNVLGIGQFVRIDRINVSEKKVEEMALLYTVERFATFGNPVPLDHGSRKRRSQWQKQGENDAIVIVPTEEFNDVEHALFSTLRNEIGNNNNNNSNNNSSSSSSSSNNAKLLREKHECNLEKIQALIQECQNISKVLRENHETEITSLAKRICIPCSSSSSSSSNSNSNSTTRRSSLSSTEASTKRMFSPARVTAAPIATTRSNSSLLNGRFSSSSSSAQKHPLTTSTLK